MLSYKAKLIGRTLRAVVLLLAIVAITEDASALGHKYPPYSGNPTVYIGLATYPTGLTHAAVVWIYPGVCVVDPFAPQTTFLKDDWVVHGVDGGNDNISVISSGTISNACGGATVTALNYGGRYLDLEGRGGHDRLQSGPGDTYMIGGAGNDVIISGRPNSYLSGSEGNDTVKMFVSESGGSYYGDGGNDCMNINTSSSPFNQSCGSGTDQWIGPGTKPADCENIALSCCPGEIC